MQGMNQEFGESKLFGFYEYELVCLAKNIANSCDELFQLAPMADNGSYEKCSNDAHFCINSLLSEAAKLKKLIQSNIDKKENKFSKKYKIKIARKKYYLELLEGVVLTEILKPKIRNTLEHFDEYLDQANIELSDIKNIKHDIAFSNLIVSDWGHLPHQVFPIRMYVANTRSFHNMKWSVDIGRIYEESKLILAHLRAKNTGADLLEEVGALGVVLRDLQPNE